MGKKLLNHKHKIMALLSYTENTWLVGGTVLSVGVHNKTKQSIAYTENTKHENECYNIFLLHLYF